MLRAQELIHSFSVLLNFRHVACSWTSKTAYEAASTVFGIESAAPMVYSDFMWICHRDSSSGVMETKHSVAASLQMELSPNCRRDTAHTSWTNCRNSNLHNLQFYTIHPFPKVVQNCSSGHLRLLRSYQQGPMPKWWWVWMFWLESVLPIQKLCPRLWGY